MRRTLAAATSALAVFTLLVLGGAFQFPLFSPTTGTVSGLQLTNNFNNAFRALASCNSGTSAPNNLEAGPVAGQCWLDTSTTPNRLRIYDGTSWVITGHLDVTGHLWLNPIGGGTTTLSSTGTTDIGSVPQSYVEVTGTTGITSLGSSASTGQLKVVRFAASLTLTHNATSLILPSGANITTAAGDHLVAAYLGGGNWTVVAYSRATGEAVSNPAIPIGSAIPAWVSTEPANYVFCDGRAISRASFPNFVNAVTIPQSAVRTSGSAVLTSVADTSQLGAGQPIEGTGIPAATTILSVTSTTITMSANASSSGTATATAFPLGNGNGTTTINVANLMGGLPYGRDNMSGTAQNFLTATNFGVSGQALGRPGGANQRLVLQTHIEAYTLPNTLGVNIVVDSNNVRWYQGTNKDNNIQNAGGTLNDVPKGTSIVALTATGTVTGSVTSGGSGTALPTAVRGVVTNWLCRVQ